MWAGLRSFVPDGELVGGFDSTTPEFFWMAGQGGYGIQTAAAMGHACSALLLGQPVPSALAALGVSAERLSPKRLRR
jgi:D-arginine dehydrogenase